MNFTLRLNAPPKWTADFEIPQIDIRPALRADAGLRGPADLLPVTATKTAELTKFFSADEFRELVEQRRRFEARRFLGQELFNAVVLATFTAKRRFCVSGLKLTETAVRAVGIDLLEVLRWIWSGHRGPRLPGGSRLRCRRTRAFRLFDGTLDGRHFRFTHKRRSILDDQARRLQVTLQYGATLEFATLVDGDVAMHLAQHRHRLGFDLATDFGVLADGQDACGSDLAFDFAVDDQFVLKLD